MSVPAPSRQAADRVHTVILILLSLAVGALAGWVLWTGRDFYLMPLVERPHHPEFRNLRPSGFVGHGLGILGSAMVLLLLVYSLRKRVRFMRRWGNLGVWLRYHIFLGVAGPVLITLHTSFKIHGLVAVSYWSMAAVALSGVVGRYLYQQIPRNMLGETLSAEEIEADNEAILVELSTRPGMGDRQVAELENLALGPLSRRSAPMGLFLLPFLNLMLARRLHSWMGGFLTEEDQEAEKLAKRWVLHARRLHLFHQIRDLFHYWHVFHKPFAVIMILVMLVHVAVAVALGYTWTFGGPVGG